MDVITHPFLNFNVGLAVVDVRTWMSYYIPTVYRDVITNSWPNINVGLVVRKCWCPTNYDDLSGEVWAFHYTYNSLTNKNVHSYELVCICDMH